MTFIPYVGQVVREKYYPENHFTIKKVIDDKVKIYSHQQTRTLEIAYSLLLFEPVVQEFTLETYSID